MNNINNIDFLDFYFNGHYLSEFGGIIGGKSRLATYSLLPNKVKIVDRALKQDGLTLFDTYFEPRTFEVPIFFEDLDSVGIRNIAAWLNTDQEEWFYFKNDTLKIKVLVDEHGGTLTTLAGMDGHTNIKFIAYDPFYYELNDTVNHYKSLTATTNTCALTNSGNYESFPLINVWGSGNIIIKVYTENKSKLLSTCTVKSVTSGFILDTKYRTCNTQSGASWYSYFDGEFPTIPNGKYVVEFSGTCKEIKIEPRHRFI